VSTRKELTEEVFLLIIRALREGADTRMIEEARKLVEFRPAACVNPQQENWYNELHLELESSLRDILRNMATMIGTVDDNGKPYRASGADMALVLRYMDKNVTLDERQTGRSVSLTEEARRVLKLAGEG